MFSPLLLNTYSNLIGCQSRLSIVVMIVHSTPNRGIPAFIFSRRTPFVDMNLLADQSYNMRSLGSKNYFE